MAFYQDIGALVLGTRLKRIGDRFLSEITSVYKSLNIPFEPSWFPIMYLLRDRDELLITEIAAELDVTHSAVSQLVSVLQKKKLIVTLTDAEDRRKRKVRLSDTGKDMLLSLNEIWNGMQQAMDELLGEGKHLPDLFNGLSELESAMAETPISERILKKINK